MTERTPEEIAAGLTEAQRRIIAETRAESECEYPFQCFKHMAADCGLTIAEVKDAMPSLRADGVMIFRSGLWNDDGPYGSGYALSDDRGLAVRTLIEKDSRRGG